jgi:hypothetical protein
MPRLRANSICQCGKTAVARGLCRGCYDKSRLIPRIAIDRDIQADVEARAKKSGRGMSHTVNELLKFGLKYIDKIDKIKEEYGI